MAMSGLLPTRPRVSSARLRVLKRCATRTTRKARAMTTATWKSSSPLLPAASTQRLGGSTNSSWRYAPLALGPQGASTSSTVGERECCLLWRRGLKHRHASHWVLAATFTCRSRQSSPHCHGQEQRQFERSEMDLMRNVRAIRERVCIARGHRLAGLGAPDFLSPTLSIYLCR